LGLGFGFVFRVLGLVTRTLHKSKSVVFVTWPIRAIGIS